VGVRTGTLGLRLMATVRHGINGRSVHGAKYAGRKCRSGLQTFDAIGRFICGKTPVIHNLTTYKPAITFEYHIMSKIPNNLIINTD
jgi:hypothetical protein